MACNHKKASDIELLTLYRQDGDLTAYKVLLEKYERYSKKLAGEIVSSFRSTFLPDYNELVLIGIFSFEIATKLFDFEKTLFHPYWRKIAKQKMMDEVYFELEEYSFIHKNVIYGERCGLVRNGFAISSFSNSLESSGDLLMQDIMLYLDDPKNGIKPFDKTLFLEYLEEPSFKAIADKHNRCIKSIRARINKVRSKIIKDVLGEDI